MFMKLVEKHGLNKTIASIATGLACGFTILAVSVYAIPDNPKND